MRQHVRGTELLMLFLRLHVHNLLAKRVLGFHVAQSVAAAPVPWINEQPGLGSERGLVVPFVTL